MGDEKTKFTDFDDDFEDETAKVDGADKIAAEKEAAEKAATDKAATDKAAAEKAAAEADGDDKTATEKEAAEKAATEAGTDAEKAAAEKVAAEKAAAEGEDFFADDEGKKVDDSGKDKFSYKPIAKEFGVELENDTQEELTKKVNEKLVASKLELNLEDYSEQARSLIKHLNDNKGDIGAFLTSPTVNEMQGILNMEPEDKVRMIRMNEMKKEGKTEEQAITAYNEELDKMSVSEIRKMSDNIDKQAKGLRDQEIVKITGDKETQMKTERETKATKVEKEKTVLKTYIQAREDFLGLDLTPKARAQILSDLESGKFDELVEKAPEASRFFAYMTNKFGSKITENFSKGKKDANRAGYNAATDKSTGALHNDKKLAAGKSGTGHQKGEEGTKQNLDTWTDDLFEADDE